MTAARRLLIAIAAYLLALPGWWRLLPSEADE